jgi:DNA-binding XRE family transcriptional regulator
MNPTSKLASLLKQERKRNRLTQEMLAERAGVNLETVRNMEQERGTTRIETANRVLALFGYRLEPVPFNPYSDESHA